MNNRYTNEFLLANFPRKRKFYLLYMENIDMKSAILWIANFVHEIDKKFFFFSGVFLQIDVFLSFIQI